MNKYAVVLAAGKGTRMKSSLHKVLHQVLGKSMVDHAVTNLEKIGVDKIVTVIGYEAESVRAELQDRVEYAMQTEQLGTGHAVMMTKELLEGLDGVTIVTYGDVPLLTEQTISNLFDYHQSQKAAITILTAKAEDPTGYGRIVRDGNEVLKIVEHKDCTEEELKINEMNAAIYCFDIENLLSSLEKLSNDNKQGEYYLTDVIGILKDENKKVGALSIDYEETIGVNSRVQLAEAEEVLRKRINKMHMENGVTLIDPSSTYIGDDVEIGRDTIIYPGNVIEGNTKIGEGVMLYPNSRINNSKIGNNVEIQSSVILDSTIGEGTTVGPFAYVRPESAIGNHCRIGDFVEIKKSTIGNNTKVSHLTYIGDAKVGEHCNFGCGTVVVNYDGKKKNTTIIGNNSFIGCNTNLVSPVTVEDNTYIAAGSTIVNDVKEGELAVARAKQRNIEGWVAKKGFTNK